MLKAVELPAGVTDLATSLADVDRDGLTHVEVGKLRRRFFVFQTENNKKKVRRKRVSRRLIHKLSKHVFRQSLQGFHVGQWPSGS
jgi:hypothetical protein